MSSKISGGSMAVGVPVLVVIFLAVTKQVDAQAFLLTYSDERVSTKIGQTTLELGNNTNITEVYTVTSSTKVPSEFSQTTMDAITVVWYLATFLALMAFFVLMACSDRRCGNPADATPTAEEQQHQQPPPTPAPSYSEFAPPSYDTVVTKNFPSVFVVQVPYLESEKDKDPPPPFTFQTINELQKSS